MLYMGCLLHILDTARWRCKWHDVCVQVLDFIHYCDVAEYMAKDKIAGTTEWGWTRQLRYYHRAEGSVKVCSALHCESSLAPVL